MVDHSINSETVISSIDEFCSHIGNKKTVLVIDNARIHTSNAVNGQWESWKKSGLELFFLPVYSPELNLIEILWRKIKYEWLPFSSYKGIENLRRNLNEILDNFGTVKYNIDFA